MPRSSAIGRGLAWLMVSSVLWVGVPQLVADDAGKMSYAGRPLVSVLRDFQNRGLRILYSSDLVRPDMMIGRTPTATTLHGILEQLLAPHGLKPEIGPLGSVLVVRKEPRYLPVAIDNPTSNQAVFGEIEVSAVVDAEAEVDRVEFFVNDHLVAVVADPPYRALVDIGEENLDREFRVVAYGIWGDKGTSTVRTRQVEFEAEVEIALKQVYVTITRSGDPVTDLDAGDFTVIDNGARRNLVTFERGDVPLTAVLLVDASESMKKGYIEATSNGSRAFLTRMNPLDQAMLMLFSDRTLAASPFSQRTEELLRPLNGTPYDGGTALNDHLYAALKVLDQQQGRRVVILLSDGRDVLSTLRMEDVLWKVRRSDAVVYWIRLLKRGRGSFSSAWRDFEENSREQEELERAVKQSGGRIVALSGIDEIEGAFDDIMTELREQYVLGYYPESRSSDGRWRSVKVKVEASGAKVRYSTGYIDN
ncbi:MAG: VWA domain-containing protein [Acidobacteria bacterium]|nr:MAG: VWA domain-containing protein [Acidobacteriota bacterium]